MDAVRPGQGPRKSWGAMVPGPSRRGAPRPGVPAARGSRSGPISQEAGPGAPSPQGLRGEPAGRASSTGGPPRAQPSDCCPARTVEAGGRAAGHPERGPHLPRGSREAAGNPESEGLPGLGDGGAASTPSCGLSSGGDSTGQHLRPPLRCFLTEGRPGWARGAAAPASSPEQPAAHPRGAVPVSRQLWPDRMRIWRFPLFCVSSSCARPLPPLAASVTGSATRTRDQDPP